MAEAPASDQLPQSERKVRSRERLGGHSPMTSAHAGGAIAVELRSQARSGPG